MPIGATDPDAERNQCPVDLLEDLERYGLNEDDFECYTLEDVRAPEDAEQVVLSCFQFDPEVNPGLEGYEVCAVTKFRPQPGNLLPRSREDVRSNRIFIREHEDREESAYWYREELSTSGFEIPFRLITEMSEEGWGSPAEVIFSLRSLADGLTQVHLGSQLYNPEGSVLNYTIQRQLLQDLARNHPHLVNDLLADTLNRELREQGPEDFSYRWPAYKAQFRARPSDATCPIDVLKRLAKGSPLDINPEYLQDCLDWGLRENPELPISEEVIPRLSLKTQLRLLESKTQPASIQETALVEILQTAASLEEQGDARQAEALRRRLTQI